MFCFVLVCRSARYIDRAITVSANHVAEFLGQQLQVMFTASIKIRENVSKVTLIMTLGWFEKLDELVDELGTPEQSTATVIHSNIDRNFVSILKNPLFKLLRLLRENSAPVHSTMFLIKCYIRV